jgi:ABC-2 type transport system permease protein
MNKVLLIIQREYLVRVKKKSFVVMTLLVPGLILAMWGIIFLIINNSNDINKIHLVRVHDESGVFKGKFKNKATLLFADETLPLNKAKADLKKNNGDFLLIIPKNYAQKNAVQILSESKPNFTLINSIEDQMADVANADSRIKAGIDTAKLNAIKTDISVSARQITDHGEQDSNLTATYGAGIAGAILIYISLFIYGAQVMRGVIEEKTNRIIEVIISSVKPFQLMMGKIIGVGMVGLTQFILWIVLSIGVTIFAGNLFVNNKHVSTEKTATYKNNSTQTKMTATTTTVAPPKSPVLSFYNNAQTLGLGRILGWFLFYFITGYLLYSALFAAVGSAVDSETETQQFMFPITLPLLFTYILSFAFLINAPDSSLAFWLSIIPFTAPVAMMVRVPFGVPDWQLALSAFMMIVGFLFTTWVASRIYRVGILMYGKKTSYKELAKWFFYKE